MKRARLRAHKLLIHSHWLQPHGPHSLTILSREERVGKGVIRLICLLVLMKSASFREDALSTLHTSRQLTRRARFFIEHRATVKNTVPPLLIVTKPLFDRPRSSYIIHVRHEERSTQNTYSASHGMRHTTHKRAPIVEMAEYSV